MVINWIYGAHNPEGLYKAPCFRFILDLVQPPSMFASLTFMAVCLGNKSHQKMIISGSFSLTEQIVIFPSWFSMWEKCGESRKRSFLQQWKQQLSTHQQSTTKWIDPKPVFLVLSSSVAALLLFEYLTSQALTTSCHSRESCIYPLLHNLCFRLMI